MKSIKIKPVEQVGCAGCVFQEVKYKQAFAGIPFCVGSEIMEDIAGISCGFAGVVFKLKEKKHANAAR